MYVEIRVINGVEVPVTVCKPSRRKAGLSIQKARRQRSPKPAKWIAKDRGLVLR